MEKSDSNKESSSKGNGSRPESAKKPAGRNPRIGSPHLIAIGLAVVAILVLWLLLSSDDDSGSSEAGTAQSQVPSVQLVSQSQLLEAMTGAGYPIYWAGPRLGVEYEVSRPEEGRTFVRYLPKGEKAGSEKPFLTVGSYRQPDALAGIRELGQKPGAILIQVAGGGAGYADGPNTTSAYLAFPGVETQVEVYDPHPGQALSLVRSGAIVPVG